MPTPIPFVNLAQIPGLERLPEVCEAFDIEITAFGSVVRRLADHLLHKPKGTLPNLFALSPFLSDIDIRHTGRTEQLEAIREAICGCVPYSECFRWQIFGDEELRQYDDEEVYLPVIPANKLTLSTRSNAGIKDPFDGASDLLNKQFRLLRNPFYGRSKLRATHRDCELLHALFFLQLRCEHVGEKSEYQPGNAACSAIADHPPDQQTAIALAESSYLRAKLLYRFNGIRAACKSDQAWDEIIKQLHLGENSQTRQSSWFRHWVLEDVPKSPFPVICGCHIGGSLFRFPRSPDSPNQPQDAAVEWASLQQNHSPLEFLSAYPFPDLPETQKVVAASSPIPFVGGKAPCANGNEHLHLELAIEPKHSSWLPKCPNAELGVLVVFSGQASPHTLSDTKNGGRSSCVVTLPSACTVRKVDIGDALSSTFLQVRINFGRLLEVFPEILKKSGIRDGHAQTVQVFVVAEDPISESPQLD